MSSGLRPLDSRKVTLRSVGSSLIDSSSRNLDACASRSSRDVVEGAGALSELGADDGDPSAVLLALCHEGMEALGVSSGIMICLRPQRE
jgi:hypothetical protein